MNRLPHLLLAAYVVLFFVCAIAPHDRATWLAENLPIVGICATLLYLAMHRRTLRKDLADPAEEPRA